MAKLTFEEAAEAVGVARQTIWRAAGKGKLSHTKDENGVSVVDTSELFRVYEPTEAWLKHQRGETDDTVADAPEATTGNASRNAALEAELRLWREKFEMAGQMHGERLKGLQDRIQELMQDREDLRGERDSLLKTLQEQAVSVRLLTDQSAQRPIVEKSGLFGLFRRRHG